MTRIFTDGAELGNLTFWDTISGCSASTVNKRSGAYSYYFPANNNNLSKNLNPTLSEFYLRYALYPTVNFNDSRIPRWMSGGTEYGALRVEASTSLVKIYVNGSIVATGTHPIPLNSWTLFEVHVKIADSGGMIEVYTDGSLDATFYGDTKPNASALIDSIGWFDWSSTFYIDDLALNDTNNTDGLNDNSWCGDGHILFLIPNGNGDVTGLLGSDGDSTDNYLLVDDVPPNTTDYVRCSGSNAYELYNITDTGLADYSIQRISIIGYYQNTLASGVQVGLMFKTGGTEYVPEPRIVSSVGSFSAITTSGIKTNPKTLAPWTLSDIDDLQIGFKKI